MGSVPTASEWLETRVLELSPYDRMKEEYYRQEFEEKAQERWDNSGKGVVDYVRSRLDEGEPPFDLDWETAREMAHEWDEGGFR